MIVPDLNLLIYAHNGRGEPTHDDARAWWEACLNGRETVGLLPAVAFGFIRLVTSPRMMSHSVPVRVATVEVRRWLGRSQVTLLQPSAAHLEKAFQWLDTLGTGGNLTTDAHIAAAALETGATVHTADADFARFPGLKWINPLKRKK